MKIRIELDDDRVFEADVSEKTMFCTADRYAFEEEFGISAAVFEDWRPLFAEDGTPKDGADFSKISERQLGFMMWRELRRRTEGVPDWATVKEHVIEITAVGAPDAEDPTTPA